MIGQLYHSGSTCSQVSPKNDNQNNHQLAYPTRVIKLGTSVEKAVYFNIPTGIQIR